VTRVLATHRLLPGGAAHGARDARAQGAVRAALLLGEHVALGLHDVAESARAGRAQPEAAPRLARLQPAAQHAAVVARCTSAYCSATPKHTTGPTQHVNRFAILGIDFDSIVHVGVNRAC